MPSLEKELYEPVRAALHREFASIGRGVVSETAASKGLGESIKALIPVGGDILFRFLSLKPDIIGYAQRRDGRELFTVEVKRGKATVRDIYQAKLYKELFGAGIGFLIVSGPIPEELKRLIRNRPTILMSAEWHEFELLALGQFDPATGEFADWVGSHSLDPSPFTHLSKLGL
jgi:hypothetical protein